MTKTRNVGGKIKETTKGNDTSFAKENIVHNSQKKVTFTSDKGVSLGTPANAVEKECTCKVSKKATNFKSLLALVKQAEEMLIANEQTSMGDRINTLRGIYYGSVWSMDYSKEASTNRNTAFTIYTGCSVKYDARVALKCSNKCKAKLFESLFDSPEVFDSPYKAVDFGHLVIGLDARRSWTAKNIKIPTQGGTGLELNTWVGDLGGGTATLSKQRVSTPQKRAKTMFTSQHDYGAMVNLEGDIAAYVVGMDDKNPGDIVNPTVQFTTLHEALQDYFDHKWDKRAFYFMAMLGAEVSGNVLKYDKDELVADCAKKFDDFAVWYLGNRMKDKKSGGIDDFANASKNFKPASEEIASIFIDALIHVVSKPGDMITARTDPNPKPAEDSVIHSMKKGTDDLLEKSKKILDGISF